MTALRYPLVAIALVLLAHAASAMAASAVTPHGFTAVYAVQRNGNTMGTSTLSLKREANGDWTYASTMQANRGLAAMLGADVKEVSRFRWHNGRPEALSYDYRFDTAFKRKHRRVTVDWATRRVSVDIDGRKHFTYATRPGLVERHSVPLALAFALHADARDMNLPVAVKDRVETQRYRAVGHETIDVPAGRFDAERVNRIDDDKGFAAWYVPGRFLAPVKLTQHSGGTLTLLLKSYRAR